MVGFESNLRQSRRRGWEDAYLDYQSLNLLLTQIEAVYEEEDWKRDSFAHLSKNLDELAEEGGIADDSMVVTANDGYLNALWKTAARMTRQIVVPGICSRSSTSSIRRSRGDGFNSTTNADNNWISNDYFDYSLETYRRKQIRGGEDSSYDRALDRGGWRSPGVIDYRDELFLVSDEDAAYGNSVEGQSDDDDDWMDDEEEESLSKEFYEAENYSSAHHNDDEIHSDTRIDPAADDVKSVSKKLAPVMEALENKDSKMHDSNRIRNDSAFGSKRVHLWTPDASPTASPTNEKRKVKFSDSPGVLEAGYETFAAAAARRGFSPPGGDESHILTVGSPSEQRGWFGGVISNWLGGGTGAGAGGGGRQPKSTTETDPLLLSRRDSNGQVFGRSAATDKTSNSMPSPSQNNQFTTSSPQNTQNPNDVGSWLNISHDRMAYMTGELQPPLTPLAFTETNSLNKTIKPIPVPATAVGGSMPETPTKSPSTPQFTFVACSEKQREQKKSSGGFGLSLNMIPTTEFLHPSTFNRKSPEGMKLGMSQFYSFQKNDDNCPSSHDGKDVYSRYPNEIGPIEEYNGGDEHELGMSNMISFYSYSGGNDDGYMSVRSPTPVARRHNPSQQRSLSLSEKRLSSESSGGEGVLRYLFGTAYKASSKGNNRFMPQEGGSSTHRNRSTVQPSSTGKTRNQSRSGAKHGEAGKRKRARLRKQRQLRRQRDRVPLHLRLAHARAATITERFRGLLRAEVEKVILFTNSRLGELSDTIGSLQYSSNEDGHDEMRKKTSSLVEVGMHQLSSSDSDDGDSGQSSASSLADEQEYAARNRGDNDHRRKIDSSETKKQLVMRDRLRISKPLFQKADFLGEDFSLLSAVDEVDCFTAIGVELLHLLKYICVNVIAVRKICKKHDTMLANRMLGGYYQRFATESKEISIGKQRQLQYYSRRDVEPQQFGGYIMGIYDTKIQHIANSTTMETVSSSLAIALADFKASQSRSVLLGLGFALKGKGRGSEKVISMQPELPPPSHKASTTSRLRDAAINRISRQCLRGDDDSTVASQDDENSCTSTPITRLQYVVTSIFGLREAARRKSNPFEHLSSRLFLISTGPNVADDGLDGCSRQTLAFFRSYQPDAAYSLDLERFYSSHKITEGIMVASLAAASKDYNSATLNRTRFRRHVAASMSINPLCTWGENGLPLDQNGKFQNILRLNAASVILYLTNYYCIVPTAHLFAKSLDSGCSAAVLIGAANVSSLLGLGFQSLLVSKRYSFRKRCLDIADFQLPISVCSTIAIAGNILLSYALKKSSIGMAIAGRLLVGFGSAEFLNRQLLSTISLQENINTEVARLSTMTMVIIPISIVLGSVFDIEERPIFSESMQSTSPSLTFLFNQRTVFSLESIGYVMAVAWGIHLLGMVFFFDPPETQRRTRHEPIKSDELQHLTTQEEDFDSDNEERDSLKQLESNPFVSTKIGHGEGTFEKLQIMSRKNVKHNDQLNYSECIANVRQLIFSNVASPTTISILFIVRMTHEILLSSCGTLASRYFNWSGARSGCFLGLMTSSIFPVNYALASKRNVSERYVMKTALRLTRLGLILMVNYESIFVFFASIYSGSLEKDSSARCYDDFIGVSQYLLSFAVIYLSDVTLESVTLTLMSKVQSSPRKMKKYTIDNSFVVILESAVARIVGDLLVHAFDVSDQDIVNCIAFSLLIAFSAGIFVVRKHYFFLR